METLFDDDFIKAYERERNAKKGIIIFLLILLLSLTSLLIFLLLLIFK